MPASSSQERLTPHDLLVRIVWVTSMVSLFVALIAALSLLTS